MCWRGEAASTAQNPPNPESGPLQTGDVLGVFCLGRQTALSRSRVRCKAQPVDQPLVYSLVKKWSFGGLRLGTEAAPSELTCVLRRCAAPRRAGGDGSQRGRARFPLGGRCRASRQAEEGDSCKVWRPSQGVVRRRRINSIPGMPGPVVRGASLAASGSEPLHWLDATSAASGACTPRLGVSGAGTGPDARRGWERSGEPD